MKGREKIKISTEENLHMGNMNKRKFAHGKIYTLDDMLAHFIFSNKCDYPDNTLGFNLGPKTSLCDRPNSLDKSRLLAV